MTATKRHKQKQQAMISDGRCYSADFHVPTKRYSSGSKYGVRMSAERMAIYESRSSRSAELIMHSDANDCPTWNTSPIAFFGSDDVMITTSQVSAIEGLYLEWLRGRITSSQLHLSMRDLFEWIRGVN